MRALLAIVLALLASGCGEKSDLDAPKKFFAENQIGDSPVLIRT